MFLKLILALGISLVITLVIMPKLIPYLHKIKFGQEIRKEGPKSHQAKKGTPTMGGIVFVIVPIITMLIVDINSIANKEMLLVLFAYLAYATIGFIDDYIIVVKKNNEGLTPGKKFFMQSVVAVIFYLVFSTFATRSIMLPILNVNIDLGILYFPLVYIMLTAESNAVNLTDGLDGLCAGTSIISIAPFLIFAIIQEKQSLAILLIAVIGALLGYLKYNIHPAKIFMGDTGSLALGGLLAASAMILKKELLLIIIGGVFLAEVLSVIIQVVSYKLTKKRVFKMAPLHHHFELSGYKETQVVIMFWSAALILSIIGLVIGVI
ncbi:MAG: phospho-N-acetylmuramoyl-pentapeptide-transferase [Erysipelotrichaceae bacterium]